ncbi:MAG: hypothetical protein M3464_07580 [Chloroflexota bacterium]|nr:hypothetical protein [Chloroflexota bacterium]
MTLDHGGEPARAAALAAFDPLRFGFHPAGTGWIKEFSSLGPVVFAALGWQHARMRSHHASEHGEITGLDALELVVELQRQTWGMAPEELVPANVLAVLAESGGSVIVAYRRRAGFTVDGWLGFVISLGTDTGTLLSHMLGVRAEARGRHDIGWYLKLVQAHEALRRGYVAASWTFDPMRGVNARLNLEKLGAVVTELTLDKYGTLRSSLYGDVPSDRFTAHWDLLSPATAERIRLIASEGYQALMVAEVQEVPIVTLDSIADLVVARPPRLRYQIPGDIDQLMRDDPASAIGWRQEMRQTLAALVTTKSAGGGVPVPADPVGIGIAVTPGAYIVTGIATGSDSSGERQSWYLLERKERAWGE